ncbi:enoyl-CoA hydratase/isomerase family protein [Homoserinimonas sp. A447]
MLPDCELKDEILYITFNRPEKLNAFTHETYDFIRDRVTEASDDPAVRAIVLRGQGRAFSAGFDLSVEAGDKSLQAQRNSLRSTNSARWAIWNCRKPVIAAIHGYCLGGVFEMVLPADFTIATEDCLLGEPEITFNAGPAFMMVPWMMNHKQAKDVLLTGRKIAAAEALRIGLVTTVVPNGELDAEVERLTTVIRKLPDAAITMNKLGINRAYEAQGMAAHMEAWVDSVVLLQSFEDPETHEFLETIRTSGASAGIRQREVRLGGAANGEN